MAAANQLTVPTPVEDTEQEELDDNDNLSKPSSPDQVNHKSNSVIMENNCLSIGE